MLRTTKHYASDAYRKNLQIFPFSAMAITLLPTIEHTKTEILISPTIGNINAIFNQLRTSHAIAYILTYISQ